jgi:hypothetical protein
MANAKVLIDYSDVAEGDLDNVAMDIHDSLDGNINFTWPGTEVADLKTLTDDYAKKYQDSLNGSPADTTKKNAAKKALLKQLNSMASVVNLQANGDKTKLESSGFTLAADRAPVGILPKPENFKVKSGANSGDLLFEVNANTDASTYLFYTALVPEPDSKDEWRTTPSNKRKINVSGFKRGKEYACCCAYKGSETTLVFSDTVRIIVQ